MNWLFDQPVAIGIGGATLVFLLAAAWVQSGRNLFLYLAGAALLLTGSLIAAERAITTDREAVTAAVYQLALAVEANDIERVARSFVRSRPEWADKARNELPRYDFTEVRITQMHLVEVNAAHQPPEAIVEMNVAVSGEFSPYPARNFLRWVRLKMWKEDDNAWRVADYEHDEPTRFMKQRLAP
jgi:hypothetical protein